jgi:type IV pilus assembly protein PilN
MYEVNLLPPELQRAWGVSTRRFFLVVVVSAGIALVIFGYAFFLVEGYLARNELAAVQERLAATSVRAREANNLKQRRQEADTSYKVREELIGGRQLWADMFDDINVNVPVDVWLTEMKVYPEKKAGDKAEPAKGGQQDKTATEVPPRPDRVYIKGAAWSVPSIGVLLSNLAVLPYFNEVTLEEFHRDEELGVAVFSISASVKGGVR